MTIGAYPFVSLADDREKRDQANGILWEGHDPVVVKKLKEETALEVYRQTFERLARELFENPRRSGR